MDLNPNPDQAIVNPATLTPPYTVLTFNGTNYRVLTQQYRGFIEMTKVWSVFWLLLSTSMLGQALILLFLQQVPYLLIVFWGCLSIFVVYTLWKRQKITHSLIYSSINLLFWLTPIIILVFLKIKQLIIPFCFYIMIEALISFKFMTNRSKLIGKLLLITEALIIVLKADEKIQNRWEELFFIHVIAFFILSFCVLTLTAYLLYLKFIPNLDILMKKRLPGIMMMYFNSIGFCLLSAIPLFNYYLNISYWIVCFSLSGVFALFGTYIYFYRKDIVILFCTLNQIKAFDQIISFQPIQEIRELIRYDFFDRSKIEKIKPVFLYRLSSNYLSKEPIQKHHDISENPQQQDTENNLNDKNEDTKLTDCIVCMDRPAQVVWMPCGHLTVCTECCSSMFDKKNLNCVLCKKTPQQIFFIETQQKDENQKVNQQKNLETSIQKDDLTMVSNNQNFRSTTTFESKTNFISEKQSQKPQKVINRRKGAIQIREGYNVKIL